jgi:hypothetical protein
VEIRGKIEEEKEDLKKLQHPPKANSLATEGTNKGESELSGMSFMASSDSFCCFRTL